MQFKNYRDSINFNRFNTERLRLVDKMNGLFGDRIAHSIETKILFLIPGKDVTVHQVVWPEQGGLSTYNATTIKTYLEKEIKTPGVKIEIV